MYPAGRGLDFLERAIIHHHILANDDLTPERLLRGKEVPDLF